MRRKLLIVANLIFTAISSIASSGIIADAVRHTHTAAPIARLAPHR
jgi:hypothetical protein